MPRDRFYQFLSLFGLLALWELSVSGLGLVSPDVLLPPSAIAGHTVVILSDERFLTDLFATVRRTALASSIAAVVGVTLGLVMGWNDTLKALLTPQLSAIYPLPVIALLPLVTLVFGTGDASLVFTAALGGFFLVLWNAMDGARRIRSIYFDVAADNGASSPATVFREVLFPGALPSIFVGLRLCVNTALLIVISAELLTADTGLGYFLWNAYRTYSLGDVYAALVVVGALGVLATYGLGWLGRRLISWQSTDRGRPAVR